MCFYDRKACKKQIYQSLGIIESNITILATDKAFKEFFYNKYSEDYVVKLAEFLDKDKVVGNELDMSDTNRYCMKVLLRRRELKRRIKGGIYNSCLVCKL